MSTRKITLTYIYFRGYVHPMKTETIQIRVTEDWLRKLDDWRNSQPVPPTRADVFRTAVERFMDDNAARERVGGGNS